MKRTLAVLSLALVMSVALAQEVEPSLTNIADWFGNPALAIAAVAAFVAWLRKVMPSLDGPVAVPLAAIVAGAVGGALGQLAGWLTVDPFMSISFPFGGLLYGVAAGVGAVFSVNLFELLTTKLGKALIGLVNGGDSTVDPDPADTAASTRLRR